MPKSHKVLLSTFHNCYGDFKKLDLKKEIVDGTVFVYRCGVIVKSVGDKCKEI